MNSSSAYGILNLYEPQDGGATIDIVAIHGLDGHREDSWTANSRDGLRPVLWLRDLLPHHLPTARILTYGYDCATNGNRQLSHQSIYGHAEKLVTSFTMFRRETATHGRPIVFVTHSLGGIVLKFALVQASLANERHLAEHMDFKNSTSGIMFLGTPHQGVDNANNLAITLYNIQSASTGLNSTKVLLQHLERDCEYLQDLLSMYTAIGSRINTKFVYETYATALPSGQELVLVPKASAVIPGMVNSETIGFQRDHINIVKFGSGLESDFVIIASLLKEMARNPLQHLYTAGVSRDKNISEAIAKVHQMRSVMKENQLQELVNWVGVNRSRVDFEANLKKCAKNTGLWFLEDDKFTDWIDGKNKVLWCPGDPGAGKSVLSAVIIEYLTERFSPDPSTITVFAYFNYAVSRTYRALDILKDLLQQLLRHGIRTPECQTLIEKVKKAGGSLRLEQVWDALCYELKSYSRVFVVIDALDEAIEDDCSTVLNPFLEVSSMHSMRILATSRPIHSIPEAFQSACRLQIQAPRTDLEIHARQFVKEHHNLRSALSTPGDVRNAINKVLDKSAGMFLLVTLNLAAMDHQGSKHGIRAQLEQLSSNPKEAYDKVIEQIRSVPSPTEKAIALQALAWVLHCHRPMGLTELQYAITLFTSLKGGGNRARFEPEDLESGNYILQVTRGLLTLRKRDIFEDKDYELDDEDELENQYNETVEFIHFTAHKYLGSLCDIPGPSHLATICNQYLLCPDLNVSQCQEVPESQVRERYPFLPYVRSEWGVHVREVDPIRDTAVFKQSLEVLSSKSAVAALSRQRIHYWVQCPTSKDESSFHIAIHLGLVELFEHLLASLTGSKSDSLAGNYKGHTPLYYAAKFGQLKCATMLWQWGGTKVADIPAGKLGKWCRTPLVAAVRRADLAMVQFLVSVVKVDVGQADGMGRTPLVCAAFNDNIQIVKWLVEVGKANVNQVGKNWSNAPATTVLKYFVKQGNLQMVTYLLKVGKANPNVDAAPGRRTPLICAGCQHKSDVVQCLILEGQADINRTPTNKLGYSALMHTVYKNPQGRPPNLDIVDCHVQLGGADSTVEDSCGQTALHHAANQNSVNILRILIEFGKADVEARDLLHQTPLLLAAKGGYLENVKYLVRDAQADISAVDKFGSNALHLAAKRGRWDMINYLVRDNQADINAIDNSGSTALHLVAKCGHWEMVKYLVRNTRADISAVDKFGLNILHLAARSGHWESVKYLMRDAQVNINAVDKSGSSILHLAATCGHLEMVKYLVREAQADINAVDNFGSNILHLAAALSSDRSLEVVEYLIEDLHIDVQTRRHSDGWTALHVAASCWNLRVAECLLVAGKANTEDWDDRTPQMMVVVGDITLQFYPDQAEVIAAQLPTLLKNLSMRALVDARRPCDGRTALHEAVTTGWFDLVKHLVEVCNAKVNVEDYEGKTPLNLALELIVKMERTSKILKGNYNSMQWYSNLTPAQSAEIGQRQKIGNYLSMCIHTDSWHNNGFSLDTRPKSSQMESYRNADFDRDSSTKNVGDRAMKRFSDFAKQLTAEHEEPGEVIDSHDNGSDEESVELDGQSWVRRGRKRQRLDCVADPMIAVV